MQSSSELESTPAARPLSPGRRVPPSGPRPPPGTTSPPRSPPAVKRPSSDMTAYAPPPPPPPPPDVPGAPPAPPIGTTAKRTNNTSKSGGIYACDKCYEDVPSYRALHDGSHVCGAKKSENATVPSPVISIPGAIAPPPPPPLGAPPSPPPPPDVPGSPPPPPAPPIGTAAKPATTTVPKTFNAPPAPLPAGAPFSSFSPTVAAIPIPVEKEDAPELLGKLSQWDRNRNWSSASSRTEYVPRDFYVLLEAAPSLMLRKRLLDIVLQWEPWLRTGQYERQKTRLDELFVGVALTEQEAAKLSKLLHGISLSHFSVQRAPVEVHLARALWWGACPVVRVLIEERAWNGLNVNALAPVHGNHPTEMWPIIHNALWLGSALASEYYADYIVKVFMALGYDLALQQRNSNGRTLLEHAHACQNKTVAAYLDKIGAPTKFEVPEDQRLPSCDMSDVVPNCNGYKPPARLAGRDDDAGVRYGYNIQNPTAATSSSSVSKTSDDGNNNYERDSSSTRAPSAKVTCSQCGGSGKMTCSGCGGSGISGRKTQIKHGTCSGKGVVRCPNCKGHGEVRL